MITDISAAILAGGKNERFNGREKSLIKIKGISLIEKNTALLKNIFGKVYLVTNNSSIYTNISREVFVVEDVYKGIGPIGGIHAVLNSIREEAAFFVACDMPYLHNEIIKEQAEDYLLNNSDVLAARCGGRLEPLHSVYSKNLLPSISEMIRQKEYKLLSLIKSSRSRFFDVPATMENIFYNINTPADLEEIDERGIKG